MGGGGGGGGGGGEEERGAISPPEPLQISNYSRTSMTQTLMACLTCLIRTYSWVHRVQFI